MAEISALEPLFGRLSPVPASVCAEDDCVAVEESSNSTKGLVIVEPICSSVNNNVVSADDSIDPSLLLLVSVMGNEF